MPLSKSCYVFSAVLVTSISFGTGVLLGIFVICKDENGGPGAEPVTTESEVERFRAESEAVARVAETCVPPLPRHYMVHRREGQLTVDGRLDDPAWAGVPWTETFVDIRGSPPLFPAPFKATQVKVIYDDTHVHVAARLEEDQLWATYTQTDSLVFQENAFEVFFDVDRSMSWYKEYEINALGTTWDLALTRAYIDGGNSTEWDGISAKAVYSDGAVNNISHPGTFWSTEVSFPFSALNENTSRAHLAPTPGEVWFATFARPEYETQPDYNTGKYEKVPGSGASWWSWTPIEAVNLHLPSKWGLLSFSNLTASQAAASPHAFAFPDWKLYYGVFHVFTVMQEFKASHMMFETDQRLLPLDPFVSTCFHSLAIKHVGPGFEASLTDNVRPARTAHINQDRTVWFS